MLTNATLLTVVGIMAAAGVSIVGIIVALITDTLGSRIGDLASRIDRVDARLDTLTDAVGDLGVRVTQLESNR